MSYRENLIELLFHLSDKSIERIYKLATYLYIYREDIPHEKEIPQKDFQNPIVSAGRLDS